MVDISKKPPPYSRVRVFRWLLLIDLASQLLKRLTAEKKSSINCVCVDVDKIIASAPKRCNCVIKNK